MLTVSAHIELLKSVRLNSFPSGSSINYHNNQLYLVGDDANHILVLDTNYRTVQSLRLFNYSTKRIPKEKKADLETATFIENSLLILGSAATDARKQALLLPIINGRADIKQLSKPDFYNNALLTELKMLGIKEVNIEGSALVGDHLLISNRGNLGNQQNHIIFININFLSDQNDLRLFAKELALPNIKQFAGVSELCYIPSKDILFYTLSSEATSSAYTDGAIGDSFVGRTHRFSQKLQQPVIEPDELVNLTTVHAAFKNQKIEGVCAESVQNDSLVMHLVADDDKGHSQLFRIRVKV